MLRQLAHERRLRRGFAVDQDNLAQLALVAHGFGEFEQFLLVGVGGEAIEHGDFRGQATHDPEDLDLALALHDATAKRVLRLEARR